MLVLVNTGSGNSYVVDVFRVAGGSQHDWMLYGTREMDYTATSNVQLVPESGTSSTYLKDTGWANLQEGTHVGFSYPDGTFSRRLSAVAA